MRTCHVQIIYFPVLCSLNCAGFTPFSTKIIVLENHFYKVLIGLLSYQNHHFIYVFCRLLIQNIDQFWAKGLFKMGVIAYLFHKHKAYKHDETPIQRNKNMKLSMSQDSNFKYISQHISALSDRFSVVEASVHLHI